MIVPSSIEWHRHDSRSPPSGAAAETVDTVVAISYNPPGVSSPEASRAHVGGPVLDPSTLAIDPARLQARIDQLGAIGVHPNGGLFRTLYDDGWVEAMALVRRWLEEAGLATRFDAVGNL